MKFKAHPNRWRNHFLEQIHVSKDPLVLGDNAEISFKQGAEAVQEGLQTERELTVREC